MNMLMLFIGPAVFELIVLFTPAWRWRRGIIIGLTPVMAFSGVAIAFFRPGLGSYLLVAINCFRLVHYGRILEGRLHASYLLYSARRTGLWLMALGLASFGLTGAWLQQPWHLSALIAGFQLLVGLVFLASTVRQLRTTTPPDVTSLTDHQLPTLTVAIPARDETTDLNDCLTSILANKYPKLEILVLDDSSNGQVAEIIRSFAHDGVRFIPGSEPRPNWLAKNQAYQQLAHEADGDVILFCGVDIRFQPDSLRLLVTQMVTKQKQMLCVMPENHHRTGSIMYSLIQPMRYVWELALPRRLFRRPPVLSSCWLITKTALKHSGGFAAVTRMIVPESYFARQLVGVDGYSFMRSTPALGVISFKTIAEQRATAIRTRYPQLHKRVELAALVSLAELIGLTAAAPLLIANLWLNGPVWLSSLLAVAVLSQFISYGLIIRQGFGRLGLGNLINLPLAAISDVLLLNYSMWKYEFSQVYWKGRDVTPSVMHATPYLPKL